MSSITTHVLDIGRGRPAADVPVRLERLDGAQYTELAAGSTDDDGRVDDLGSDQLDAATYRLVFDTDAYFAATGQTGFYPEVSVAFAVADPAEHHHVPLLLSPFGYSTYRGS
ncbi:MAG: hydroxyisourate hydrolase [Nocardioidaceae bacterium]